MGDLRSILRGFSGQREGPRSNRNAIRVVRALKRGLGEGASPEGLTLVLQDGRVAERDLKAHA